MEKCKNLGVITKQHESKCWKLGDYPCLIKSKLVTPQLDCGENACEEYLTLGLPMDTTFLPGNLIVLVRFLIIGRVRVKVLCTLGGMSISPVSM